MCTNIVLPLDITIWVDSSGDNLIQRLSIHFELWQQIYLSQFYKITHTTSYHPQSNELLEHFHQQLKSSMNARLTSSQWFPYQGPFNVIQMSENIATFNVGSRVEQIPIDQLNPGIVPDDTIPVFPPPQRRPKKPSILIPTKELLRCKILSRASKR
ncbi:unnamed protein product [Lepeophtheirus salmonis]|uniref:(salmon louse) hypothetical protein n=1 Tax=Lepeophtheirus salmonis TaxID=72036 RepID=A0A7R8H0Z5_LEPSM|nr:unnamed protein product [Lepeophtheirus salmonis]CAF2798619.1 unnamed protein product [Lepeophtheirus salmonis]